MDKMVLFWLCCVAVVRAWRTAPVPARVDKANWCGLHAAWKWLENICAMQRDTTRRRTSPIAYNQPADAPIRFLEGYHSSNANGFGNVWWDPCLGEKLAHVNEQGGGGIVIEDYSQGVCCEAGGPWCRAFSGTPQCCKQFGDRELEWLVR